MVQASDSATRPSTGARVARVGLAPLAGVGAEVVQTLRTYNARKLRGDLIAGITVAVVALPQSMAYAIIAGVPPIYGIYTLVIQTLIAAPLSSHPLLSVGPMITQSLLVASIVTRLEGSGDPAVYLSLTIALTLIKGLIQLGLAFFRLGDLVKYISQSVIVGFTAGAGVLIITGQFAAFLGFRTANSPDDWPGLIGVAQQIVPRLNEANLWSVVLGLGALVVVIGSRSISRLMPGPLLAIALGALAVYLGGWTGEDFTLLPPLPSGLPTFTLPDITHIEALVGGATALALMGLMEAYAICRSLSSQTGGKVNANRELFSQGITNSLSSFLGSFPGSGSFSRAALNAYAGGQTMFSNVFNAAFVVIVFLLLAPIAGYIPMSAIAAILFVVAWGLIDVAYIRRAAASSRADLLVCGGTLVATLFLPLKYAVFLGIALNLALYLRRASQLQVREMVPTAAGPFLERPLSARSGDKAVVFLQVEGDLFFALADELDDRLTALVYSPVHVVILRLKRTHSIDATVLGVLERFVKQMHAHHKHVVLCGVRPDLMDRLTRFGILDLIGKPNVFETSFGVFTSAKAALNRARQLVQESIDISGIPDTDESEGWSYQI